MTDTVSAGGRSRSRSGHGRAVTDAVSAGGRSRSRSGHGGAIADTASAGGRSRSRSGHGGAVADTVSAGGMSRSRSGHGGAIADTVSAEGGPEVGSDVWRAWIMAKITATKTSWDAARQWVVSIVCRGLTVMFISRKLFMVSL